ncbi:hypothetical protein RclHR1_26940003 [Rhizophagus clarus]|uniref:Uncharacterized protein n=1 Tax=Rhizophagus clarus TaxID=94130 RepID=A0A2Z6RVU2_9GLOM|nr:hypothetical protein RclHR1_26940003 [Rhizophagus clarus]
MSEKRACRLDHWIWRYLRLKLRYEFLTYIVQNSFRGGLYDISKSGTPLEIQTFHFEDWTLFEDLVTIFEDYFEGSDEA